MIWSWCVRKCALVCQPPAFLVSTFQLMVITVIDRWLMARNGRDTRCPCFTPIYNLFMPVFPQYLQGYFLVFAFLIQCWLIDWIFRCDVELIYKSKRSDSSWSSRLSVQVIRERQGGVFDRTVWPQGKVCVYSESQCLSTCVFVLLCASYNSCLIALWVWGDC